METIKSGFVQAWRIITLYLAGVLLGGAMFAPWLYWLAESVGGLPKTADDEVSFGRYVTRSFTIIAVLGLWPLLRALKMNSWRALGVEFKPGWRRQLMAGCALGFFSLAVVVVAIKLGGQRNFVTPLSTGKLLLRIVEITISALAVGVMEELLFRGALFGALRREARFLPALLASSFIYAWLHFLDRSVGAGEVDWLSGFRLLPEVFGGLVRWNGLFPALLNLLVAGLILGLAYEQRGSLFYAIGLHAGWVFWLKLYGSISRTAPGATGKWFWGTWVMTDGWFTLIALIGLLAWHLFCGRGKSKPAPP